MLSSGPLGVGSFAEGFCFGLLFWDSQAKDVGVWANLINLNSVKS